jgi:hypothetical protein
LKIPILKQPEEAIMRKHFGIFVALLCVLVTWAGDEPWKTKAYQEWDDKDVTQILQDSPWVIASEIVEKDEVVVGSEDKPINAAPTMCKDDNGKIVPCTLPSVDLDSRQTPAHTYNLQVTWTSSRTVRKAIARRRILHSNVTEQAAEKFVAQSPEEYHLILRVGALDPLNEEAIRQTAHLKVQGSGKEIGASKVTVSALPVAAVSGAVPVGAVPVSFPVITVFFPKKGPDGTATIADGDNSVEFACKLGKLKVKVTFDLRRMTDSQGRDL